MVFKERTFHGAPPEEAPAKAALETEVAHVMALVDGLEAADIRVVSKGNTIVLTGSVATAAEAGRAEEAAKSVQGVAEVVNRIAVA